VFAPSAGYRAKGVEHEKFGEEITDFVRFNAPKPKATDARTLRGVILKVDRFGNLVTNITLTDVPWMFQAQPPAFKIVIGKQEITSLKMNYAEGTPGEVFGILGSMGYLEIAANRGAAVQITGAGKGSEVNVVLEGAVAAGNGS
jgi:S-adenosylmethionine hydrolase